MNNPRRHESSGASTSKTSLRDRFAAYLAHHKATLKDSLRRLQATPFASLMAWSVIGIAIALPCGLHVALSNLQQLSGKWDGTAQISLFLHKHVSTAQANQLANELQKRVEISQTQYINKQEALDEFQSLSGFGNALSQLDENPLPGLIVLNLESSYSTKDNIQSLLSDLQQLSTIEQIQMDLQWIKRLNRFLYLATQVALGLGVLFAIAVMLVVGNTIRLAIENRRDEIVIIKLVGGTRGFIQRPFLYTGFLYGLGGGLLAWILIHSGIWWLQNPVRQLAELYEGGFHLEGLGFLDSIILLSGSTGLGLVGAWLSVWRHLDAIEPQ